MIVNVSYKIILPTKCHLDKWYNIGIDFAPQHITANNKISGEDSIILDLNEFGIMLDNRCIKKYEISQTNVGLIEIEIFV